MKKNSSSETRFKIWTKKKDKKKDKKKLPCRNRKLGTCGEEETAARRRLHETNQKLKNKMGLACRNKKLGTGGDEETAALRRLH